MKRVFIVHRWSGSPASDWYPWLKSELENRGYDVIVPEMPNPDEPKIKEWISALKKSVDRVDERTYFIGHSIGVQAIMRYLETQDNVCGGAVFVAGWFTLQGLEDEDSERIATPWLETPMNFDKIMKNVPNSTAIFSDNDPFVPLSDKEIFRIKLGSNILVQHDMGHFTEDNACTRLPVALDELLKLANK